MSDAHKTLSAIQALMIKDLEETSDDQLRTELLEDGQDPEILDREIAESLDSVVAEFLRDRVAATKAVKKAVQTPTTPNRPVLSKIKEVVQRAFETEPSLSTAYRKGSKQSDNDWVSIYDDLLLLGKIDPEKKYD
ncbi:hypothetical protein QTI24_21510 [Variovorax sp. J22P240]|uniref:hypothetical protein n=1 Tax=Variovorax sp. J22P240 TaxID=3053514 RepID=UPI002575B320|nr:hypothetical protein [Variovorax sp. J22P240]MDM0001199.1 hypothetical protein [Variovorax sp. J22P240]